MPGIDGGTLRAWRRSRGWDVADMARQLRRAAAEPVAAHDGLVRMIRSWEDGSHEISERYELLYLRVFPGEHVNGTGLRALAGEVRARAAALPGPDRVAALEAGALARHPRDEAAVRALAAETLEQVRRAGELLGRLAALLEGGGDE
jgi:hypothetical protein